MIVAPEDLVLKVAAGMMSQDDALLVLKRLEKGEEGTPEAVERFREIRKDIISANVLRCTREGNCSIFVKRTRRDAAGQPPARGSKMKNRTGATS